MFHLPSTLIPGRNGVLAIPQPKAANLCIELGLFVFGPLPRRLF